MYEANIWLQNTLPQDTNLMAKNQTSPEMLLYMLNKQSFQKLAEGGGCSSVVGVTRGVTCLLVSTRLIYRWRTIFRPILGLHRAAAVGIFPLGGGRVAEPVARL